MSQSSNRVLFFAIILTLAYHGCLTLSEIITHKISVNFGRKVYKHDIDVSRGLTKDATHDWESSKDDPIARDR